MNGPQRRLTLTHEFVEFIPAQLVDGVLYVSIRYATAMHRCFCGCGQEVVTPLSPTDWELSFNGETVSLWPSIGNWGFPCRSHYWIENGHIRWGYEMSEALITAGRQRDRKAKERYYRVPPGTWPVPLPAAQSTLDARRPTGEIRGFLNRALAKLRRR